MKNTDKLFASLILFVSLVAIFVASCATSGSSGSKKLPKWNTTGITSISILPFEVSDNTSLQRQAASLLSSASYSQIKAANKFETEGTDHDAVFSGKINYLTVNDSTETENNYLIFERVVKISFTYSLTDKDGVVIGTRIIEDFISDYYEYEIESENDFETNARQSRGRRTGGQADNLFNEYIKSTEILLEEIIEKNIKELALVL